MVRKEKTNSQNEAQASHYQSKLLLKKKQNYHDFPFHVIKDPKKQRPQLLGLAHYLKARLAYLLA